MTNTSQLVLICVPEPWVFECVSLQVAGFQVSRGIHQSVGAIGVILGVFLAEPTKGDHHRWP